MQNDLVPCEMSLNISIKKKTTHDFKANEGCN